MSTHVGNPPQCPMENYDLIGLVEPDEGAGIAAGEVLAQRAAERLASAHGAVAAESMNVLKQAITKLKLDGVNFVVDPEGKPTVVRVATDVPADLIEIKRKLDDYFYGEASLSLSGYVLRVEVPECELRAVDRQLAVIRRAVGSVGVTA